MSISLQLYTFSGNPKTLDKSTELSAIGTALSVNFKDRKSKQNPIFEIVYSGTKFEANYCYCSTWNKYYFIDEIAAKPGGGFEIACREDVLMTFKNDILSLPIIPDRSENQYDFYYPDAEQKLHTYTRMQTKTFPYTFVYSSDLILQTVG